MFYNIKLFSSGFKYFCPGCHSNVSNSLPFLESFLEYTSKPDSAAGLAKGFL